MSDIVERLRARSFRLATSDFNAHGAKLAFEAADEIEKLREALKPFLEYPSLVDKDDLRAARKAMGETDKRINPEYTDKRMGETE